MASVEEYKIFPCIWYTGHDAEEVARFYVSVFPDSRIERVVAMAGDDLEGSASEGEVKVVDIRLFGRHFQVMQAVGPEEVGFNEGVSLVVVCEDQAEVDRYWNAFLEAGGQTMACGWLTDQFGFRWQIVPAALYRLMADDDPERVLRVMQKMQTMIKLEIAPLEEAARG